MLICRRNGNIVFPLEQRYSAKFYRFSIVLYHAVRVMRWFYFYTIFGGSTIDLQPRTVYDVIIHEITICVGYLHGWELIIKNYRLHFGVNLWNQKKSMRKWMEESSSISVNHRQILEHKSHRLSYGSFLNFFMDFSHLSYEIFCSLLNSLQFFWIEFIWKRFSLPKMVFIFHQIRRWEWS